MSNTISNDVIFFLSVVCIIMGIVWLRACWRAKAARSDNVILAKTNSNLCGLLTEAREQRDAALSKGIRAIGLLSEYQRECLKAYRDSDALAAIVAEYLKICEDVSVLQKDEHPPIMAAEREALSNHEKLVKERSNEPTRSES